MRIISRKGRSKRGATLVETTASTALIYAFVLILVYVCVEACFSLLMMNGLNQAAREGARELAMIYAKSGGGQTPDSGLIDGVFQQITVGGVVNDSSQFSATWPTLYLKNSHPPLTVTVTCTAAPGANGSSSPTQNLSLPAGVLKLWSTRFSISAMTMKATATYPLRP